MVSAIDPTVPVFGSPTTASVRNNFQIAKNEITALQAAVGITLPLPVTSGGTGANNVANAQTNLGILPITGGTMTGLLRLSGPPTDNLGATTKAYVDGYFPVAVSNGGTGANNANSALANLGGAPLASPNFTGIPTAPTAPSADSSIIIATTAFVHNYIATLPAPVTSVVGGAGITTTTVAGVATVGLSVPVSVANGGTGAGTATGALSNLGGAPLASPVFTGVPAAPTAPPGTNTTQLATTAYVLTAIGVGAGVTSAVGANGGGILVNGSTGTPAGGAITLSLLAPVSIANGGTGATTSNAAFDSLLGGIGSGSGFITRQSGGSYTLTPATLTPVNRSLIINASNAITTSSVMTDNGTAVGVSTSISVGTQAAATLPNPGLVVNTTGSASVPAPPTGTATWIIGTTGASAQLLCDGYGGAFPGILGRNARGTPGAPTATTAGDTLVQIAGIGRGATAYSANARGNIAIMAMENWTDTANGTQIAFGNCPAGSISPVSVGIWRQGLTLGQFFADPGMGCLTLNANTVAPPAGLTPNLYVVGADNGLSQLGLDCFGAANTPSIVARKALGTAAAPTAVQNGTGLFILATPGYGASAYGPASARLTVTAIENWSNTVQGSNMVLETTVAGGTTRVASLTLQGNTATFSGNVSVPNGSPIYLNGANTGTPGRFYSDATNIVFNLPGAAGSFTIQSSTGTNLSTLDSSGNFGIGGATATKASGTTWANPSARDLKQNIQPYSQGLEAVLALQPCTYEFAADSGLDPLGPHIGLIHDETAHMPEMHRTLTLGGTLDEPGREVDGLDCSAVTFALINAIKELKAELDALKVHVGA